MPAHTQQGFKLHCVLVSSERDEMAPNTLNPQARPLNRGGNIDHTIDQRTEEPTEFDNVDTAYTNTTMHAVA